MQKKRLLRVWHNGQEIPLTTPEGHQLDGIDVPDELIELGIGGRIVESHWDGDTLIVDRLELHEITAVPIPRQPRTSP